MGENKHSDERYIAVDLFQGEEATLTCRTVEMKTARKPHVCFGAEGKADHQIQPGERYRFEKARVDGDFWGQYHMCVPCLDKHIAEYEGDEYEGDEYEGDE